MHRVTRKKTYKHEYDEKIADLLSVSELSCSELCENIALIYSGFNRPTLDLHLKKLMERELVVRGTGRKGKYRLSDKGRLFHILRIFRDDSKRQKKLLRLLLLFRFRNKSKSPEFTLHEFLTRDRNDFDLNDDNIEHVEVEIPTGSGPEPEWQWESLGELDVPYDRQEVNDALTALEKVGLFAKHMANGEYVHSIIDQDIKGLIWTVWFTNFLYYGSLRDYLEDRGRLAKEERIWLKKYLGSRNAEEILREPYSTQRSLTKHEEKMQRRKNQKRILEMLRRRRNIEFNKKDLRKVVVTELISNMFEYNLIGKRLEKLQELLDK